MRHNDAQWRPPPPGAQPWRGRNYRRDRARLPGPSSITAALARLAGEFVRVGLAQVGSLALEAGHVILLDPHHGLRSAYRHLAVRTEYGKLVLKSRDVEVLVAGVVVGRHQGPLRHGSSEPAFHKIGRAHV